MSVLGLERKVLESETRPKQRAQNGEPSGSLAAWRIGNAKKQHASHDAGCRAATTDLPLRRNAAPCSYQPLVAFTIFTTESMTGTSISTPTTVASAAPDSKPNRLITAATASSKILPRVWELRNNLTAYDAVYVALAEALDAPLLTRDQRIAKAAGHRASVELV